MSEWWVGFIYGAVALSVLELLAAITIGIVVARRDKDARKIIEDRIFRRRWPNGQGG